MTILQTIENKLKQAFPDAVMSVQDRQCDGLHVEIDIYSSGFKGLSLLDQHRLVYTVLNSFLQSGEVHAFKIKTRTHTL